MSVTDEFLVLRIESDADLSKALFGKRHFLAVVAAVHRLTGDGDYCTRNNIRGLVGYDCLPSQSLATLVRIGVLDEEFYGRFEYRYRLTPGPVWDGLCMIAGVA